jgi:hypothetical protein
MPGELARGRNPTVQYPTAVWQERNQRGLPGLPLTDGERFDNGAARVRDVFHPAGEEIDAPQHGVNPDGTKGQVPEVAHHLLKSA